MKSLLVVLTFLLLFNSLLLLRLKDADMNTLQLRLQVDTLQNKMDFHDDRLSTIQTNLKILCTSLSKKSAACQ